MDNQQQCADDYIEREQLEYETELALWDAHKEDEQAAKALKKIISTQRKEKSAQLAKRYISDLNAKAIETIRTNLITKYNTSFSILKNGVRPLSIYLAGKIEQNCWRHSIVTGLKNVTDETKFLPSSINRRHHYTGPFFISCNHGCYHSNGSHGRIDHNDCAGVSESHVTVADRCVVGISESDLVFVWLDQKDCYGTLVEIGLAVAQGIPVVIASPDLSQFDDLWFAQTVSSFTLKGKGVRPSITCFEAPDAYSAFNAIISHN